eukprot:TRINITY_DN1985_c0_g1_i2.p1 TRINITY_DN1985_c0_g1~~TRINITY_DN1985_c0_g1_i2.p1  ORF type:complete len:660 (-),score=220.24 TRINITY_DN1985_c0_g1_i2:108-2087(-)
MSKMTADEVVHDGREKRSSRSATGSPLFIVGSFAAGAGALCSLSGGSSNAAFLEPVPGSSSAYGEARGLAAVRTAPGSADASSSSFSGAAASTVAICAVAAAAVSSSSLRRSAAVARRAMPQIKVVKKWMGTPQEDPSIVERFEFVKGKTVESGKDIFMNDEEAEKWLEERLDTLEKLQPDHDEHEFEDTVDELRWEWARNLLPYKSDRRRDIASHKTRTVKKQKEFFQKLRLFSPLSLRYPTILKRSMRFQWREVGHMPDIECKDLKLNPHWIYNEEKKAGFSYEDFVKSTQGNTFDEWKGKQPSVGDVLQGKVAAMSPDGAFLEIEKFVSEEIYKKAKEAGLKVPWDETTLKSWAYLPLEKISITPIANAGEVLRYQEHFGGEGDTLPPVQITHADKESLVFGDMMAKQYVVSMVALTMRTAYEEMRMHTTGAKSSIMEVEVKTMKPFGAVVTTAGGLQGLIRNYNLGDKAGDSSLVGTKIQVELVGLFDEAMDKDPTRASRPEDYALEFSYQKASTKALAGKLKQYAVVDATVTGVSATLLRVSVDGEFAQIPKSKVSKRTDFELEQLFSIGEEIKVWVYKADKGSGEVELRMDTFEKRAGDLVRDKELCFDEAEVRAAKNADMDRKSKKAVSSRVLDVEGLPSDDEDAGLDADIM